MNTDFFRQDYRINEPRADASLNEDSVSGLVAEE
jgi:hypothetical protein